MELLKWYAPLAADLLEAMLGGGDLAPTLHQVRAHPFFWPPRQQVAFLALFYAFAFKGEGEPEGQDGTSAREVEARAFRHALDESPEIGAPLEAGAPPMGARDLLKWVRKRWRSLEADEPDGAEEVVQKLGNVNPGLLLQCYRLVRGSRVARSHFYDHPTFFEERRTFEADAP